MKKIAYCLGLVAISICLMSSFAWAASDGLILYFSFDNAQGDTVPDLSGGGNDGTLANGAAIVNNIVQMGSGALQIKGGDETMSVESFPELEEYQDNTYLFWINFTDPASGSWDQILAKPAPGSDRSPGLWVHTGGLGIHYRYNPGNLGASKLGVDGEDGDFPEDEWYHVAGVKEGAVLTLYVNGAEKLVVDVPAEHAQGPRADDATGGLHVGNSPAYGGGAAKFVIDDLAIYNRALSAADVAEIMEGVTPVEPVSKLTSTWGNIKNAK